MVNMKRSEILAWLFFGIACIVLSYHACEGAVNPQYKSLMGTNQLQSMHAHELTSDQPKGKADRRSMAMMMHRDEVDGLKSVEKAKGVYGGGDALRQPRTKHKSEANSLLLKSSTFPSLTILLRYAVVGLLGLVVFF